MDKVALFDNIRQIQTENNIHQDEELCQKLGACQLDVEMETGTGKTYVYIKTMFELNKQYGWTKFIVVVPSIAIREGVKKSFDITVRSLHGAIRQKGSLLHLRQQQPQRYRHLLAEQRHQRDDHRHPRPSTP